MKKGRITNKCLICGKSILNRRPHAKYCKECAFARQKKQSLAITQKNRKKYRKNNNKHGNPLQKIIAAQRKRKQRVEI